MRRSDDVFFFTLIDFLVQVFFFGLLLFVVSQAASFKKESDRAKEAEVVRSMLDSAGVSNLAELQDHLTRLAPLQKLQGTADFVARLGGPDKANEALAMIAAAGGIEQIKDKMRKYDQAYGLPPCLQDEVNGKAVPRTLAVLRVEDQAIEFLQTSPDLNRLLVAAGLSAVQERRMTLGEFRAHFTPLRARSPSCAHFVQVQVATKFLGPLQAVWSSFRVK